MNVVTLKFQTIVSLKEGKPSAAAKKTIESVDSNPFIVITNESQFVEAATKLVRDLKISFQIPHVTNSTNSKLMERQYSNNFGQNTKSLGQLSSTQFMPNFWSLFEFR